MLVTGLSLSTEVDLRFYASYSCVLVDHVLHLVIGMDSEASLQNVSKVCEVIKTTKNKNSITVDGFILTKDRN